jgi:signal transduction histidine kinase/ActR/RegA family two-component response regulator
MKSKIRVRLVWRLVLCLFGHLTLLLILAIYLELSLNSVRRYTPVVQSLEVQLESLDTAPALLAAMAAERHDYETSANPAELKLYAETEERVKADLDTLENQGGPSTPEEKERRALIRQWLAEMSANPADPADSPDAELKDELGAPLLDRLDVLTDQVRTNVLATVRNLQEQEAREASDRVSLMWILVGSVMIFTILIQLALAQTIVGPIRVLQNAVRRLQAGDYSARAHLHSGDEVQGLGDTFNAMAENILHTQQELEEKNETLSAQQEALRLANANLEERVLDKTSELEDKNQKLKEAARLKDEFLATLSHELRTPLTPIITCAHLLGAEGRLNPDHLKNVQVIERNARALSRMIDELLDLSAVMNHKLRLVRERTELNEWLRVSLEAMRPACEKKNLALRFVPSTGPVELDIDPTRMAQVLTNLISNAIKFTEPGGRIQVRLTSTKKETRIAVTDTGAGLHPHETDQIFEMFHQTRTQSTQGVGGLGVGLAVSRSLAQLHGGGLRAESAGLGKGTTFVLWLPPSETGMFDFTSSPFPPAALPDRTILRGRRVLLVEDATDTREALQRLFERRGCRIRTAATAEEALEMARAEAPEVVISDIGLPGQSGLELIGQLRALAGTQELIAVALSGLGRDRDVKAAEEAGFDAHLLKPVEIAVLDQTLIELLERNALRKEAA